MVVSFQQEQDMAMENEISLDDRVGIVVFMRFPRIAAGKTCSKEPDSLGDKLFRAGLKYTCFIGSTGLTNERLA